MVISDWFTIVSILAAFLSFLIQNELKILISKLYVVEKIVVSVVLITIIPILIFYYEIASRCIFLNKKPFVYESGVDPKYIAFLLIIALLTYILVRLFWIVPTHKINSKIITKYLSIIDQNPAIFAEVFRKYESSERIVKNWKQYRSLILDDKALQIMVDNCTDFLLSIWKQFNTVLDFRKVIQAFLNNQNSIYYSEIKEHWNSSSLLKDKPFLNTVIKDNLTQSIHNGILMVFTDYVSKQLQSEYGKVGIYNQGHYRPKTREEEGFDLPIYYHIRFIGLMYSYSIENRIDISTISQRHTNMQTIYSNMVEQMINNIIVVEENINKEYSSNYHWLIGEIFDLQSNWVTLFSDEQYDEQRYFDANSSYISFIPFSMSLCLLELYKGLSKGKITIEFLNSIIYYSILSHYFTRGFNDVMKSSIEKEVISRIPKELVKSIFDFALDKKFAIDFKNLINEGFGLTNESEILRRLLKFLRDNNLI